MTGNPGPKNVEDLTEFEIWAMIEYLDPDIRGCRHSEGRQSAIRYRDPNLNSETVQSDDTVGLLLFIASIAVLLGGVVFIWFHH